MSAAHALMLTKVITAITVSFGGGGMS